MYLVFDIGGTNMRIAVSSDGKSISQSKTIPTLQDFQQGVSLLKQTAQELFGGQKINDIAGGIPGVLSKDKTMLLHADNLKGWVNQPLKDALEQALGTQVFLENDAALAGLGEAKYGAGKNYKIVAYLTISTGIGGARITEGSIDRKSLGFEPGYQIIGLDGATLWSLTSGTGLMERHGMRSEEIKDPKIWDEVAKLLAIGLNNTIVHWSPDIVVLGGSLMKSIQIERVKTHLQDVLTVFPTLPEIVLSTLGDSAGLYGALEYLKSKS